MAPDATVGTGTSIEALLQRITRLEDERAILDTLHRYGQAIDSGMAEAWAELFTEDGVFLCVDRNGGVILREQGRAALIQWAHALKAGESVMMKHVVLAPVITIDGECARVVSYYSNLTENEDRHAPPHVRYMGRYEDDMAKDSRGRWHFRQRVSITEAPLVNLPDQ